MALFRSGLLLLAIMFVAIDGVWGFSSDKIIKACNNSLHRDFCISSLSKAPGALEANLTQLSAIAVGLSCREAKTVSRSMEKLRKGNPSVSALEDCEELLQDTRERLHNSEAELRRLSEANFEEYIADAQTWLSAADTNQDSCLTGVQETSGSETLVYTVNVKTQNLSMLINDALAVVYMIVEHGHI